MEDQGQHEDQQPQEQVLPLGENDNWCGPTTPVPQGGPQPPDGAVCSGSEVTSEPLIATGPWFVLTPSPSCGSERKGGPNEQENWNAIQFKNGNAADNKAIELVRNGHPFVYIGRALHRLEMPVQMTTLLERKPNLNPDTQETE